MREQGRHGGVAVGDSTQRIAAARGNGESAYRDLHAVSRT
jgi:hypothetical protein